MALMRNDKRTGIPNGIRINSKTYEMLRKHSAEQMSIRMKGREPSNKGKPSPFKGKPGRKLTEEQKQKLRGRKASPEARRKMSLARKGRKVWNKGLHLSAEYR